MAVKIKKRNGDIVDFDKLKIINAINNAFLEVDGVYMKLIRHKI
jgi:hypothetical protein